MRFAYPPRRVNFNQEVLIKKESVMSQRNNNGNSLLENAVRKAAVADGVRGKASEFD